MTKIDIENTVKLKIDKGLPISPQESGRAVRVLVSAMNKIVEELEALKEKVNELSLSGSKVDSNPKGTTETTAVRRKQDI
jgi:hypothetical protein